jgi:integrase
VQGLEVRDLVLTVGADGSTKASIRLQRTKTRRHREWITDTPKSKTSKRTVPLPPWLAQRMHTYLNTVHPHEHTDRRAVAATPRR